MTMFVCDAVFALTKRWTKDVHNALPVSAENRLGLREWLTLHTRQRSLIKRGEKQGERAK